MGRFFYLFSLWRIYYRTKTWDCYYHSECCKGPFCMLTKKWIIWHLPRFRLSLLSSASFFMCLSLPWIFFCIFLLWDCSCLAIKNFSRCSVQLLSHVQLCDPMDCSMPGFPVHQQLPEPAQIHIHWVSDAIQGSHPLSSYSPAFILSQNQGLFQWVSSLHQVAKVLEFQLQYQSFQWIFRTDFL